MKIAFVHNKVGGKESHFYWSGWRAPFQEHETEEFHSSFEALQNADGEFDLCFVCPGAIRYARDCYKPASKKTKYVMVIEEDMHHSIEAIRCVAEYYDHVFIYSELNYEILSLYGVKNISLILPSADERIFFNHPALRKHDVAFLGQLDVSFKIQGFTRAEYAAVLTQAKNVEQFFGMKHYAHVANAVYNESMSALDLPIMTVVGARSLNIGLTSAVLLLPAHSRRPRQWHQAFSPDHDYIEFTDGIPGLIGKIKWLKDHEEERKAMVRRMNKKVKENHTFRARFKEMLEII